MQPQQESIKFIQSLLYRETQLTNPITDTEKMMLILKTEQWIASLSKANQN